MKPKTARRRIRQNRWKFAINTLDMDPNKKMKKLYRKLLGVLRNDVRETKNPASIRLLNECVNQ